WPAWRRNIDFRLPRRCLFSYGSIDHIVLMMSGRAVALLIATLACATVVRGNVPIIVQTGAHQRAVMKLCGDASDQLRNCDIAGAKRNMDAALHIVPKLWPALYVRAQI